MKITIETDKDVRSITIEVDYVDSENSVRILENRKGVDTPSERSMDFSSSGPRVVAPSQTAAPVTLDIDDPEPIEDDSIVGMTQEEI